MVDAAPVEEEMAEVEAKDEVCCAAKSNPNLRIKQIKTRTAEVSDARDWGIMEVAIWELELAEGKATGTSAGERFFKKRLKP
jgi:hypothetical protein